jgi:uncharacterized protein YegP (UPF0339 family)
MANRPFPSFYIFLDDDGQFRWHYQYSGNHKIEASSGEAYHNYEDCREAIDMVKAGYDAPVWRSGEVTKKVGG